MNSAEFKERYMPFHRQLYRVAYELTQNQQDAEDLLQDVYLRVWKKRDKLPPESASMGYLTVMMRNIFVEQRRLKRIRLVPEMDRHDEPLNDSTPECIAMQRDESERAIFLIKELPPRERIVMEARAIEDKSYEEIERDTGLTSTYIRQLMTRARKKLKEQFKVGSINSHR